MEGSILLHRKLLDSSVFASEKRLKIWVWLLLKATYKKRSVPIKIGKGETVITIERGQLIFGRYKAEEALNIDGSTIYKILQLFEKEEMISIQSSNHYTIIEVNNYNDYQTFDKEESSSHSTAIQQPSNNQVAANEQPSNTYNNNKNNNKDKKDKNYKKILLSEIIISDFPQLNKKYFESAKHWQKLFKKNLEDAGASTKQIENAKGVWIDDIRLMIETDGYSFEDFRGVYDFLCKNSFWKKNILSTSKLREQMAKLKLEIKNPHIAYTKQETGRDESRFGKTSY